MSKQFSSVDEHIVKFIEEQTCATLCCVDERSEPYCFNCYYVFDRDKMNLYFKSSPNAFHSELIKNNQHIAGTILPDKLQKRSVKGIQFQGEVLSKEDEITKNASLFFYKKLPVAITMSGEVISIKIDHIKMTDNSFGFGKKVFWNRDAYIQNV